MIIFSSVLFIFNISHLNFPKSEIENREGQRYDDTIAMVYLHHTYLLVTPSASFGYFIRIFFTNNTVFFTESYGHFMQINRIFAIIQPPFQANRRLLKNRQESKSSLSTN